MTYLLLATLAVSPLRTASSLNPNSPREQLLYAAAHTQSTESERARNIAWKFIFQNQPYPANAIDYIQPFLSNPIPSLKLSSDAIATLAKEERLLNRRLKGHKIQHSNELDSLGNEEIDLARALFLIQYDNDLEKVTADEAALDLLAYEILARSGKNPTPETLVHNANQLIFYDLDFRFPSNKGWEKQVDQFSLLSSVLASRRGVCLGVSTLYVCLAQRIGLNLSVYTPPGHIFVAYKNSDGEEVSIETTLRGVAIPLEMYKSVHLKSLENRPIKEVISMSFHNNAAIYLKEGKWDEAEKLYHRALKYYPKRADSLALLACCELIQGKKTETVEKLKTAQLDELICLDPIYFDLFRGSTTPDGLKLALSPIDDHFDIYVERIQDIEKLMEKETTAATSALLWQQLASLQMELGRYRSALQSLQKLSTIYPEHIPTRYFITLLLLMRKDLTGAQMSGNELFQRVQFPIKPIDELFKTLDEQCGSKFTSKKQ